MTLPLNNVLQEIAQASKASPKDFPALVKLMAAENIRLALPHAQDYVAQREELYKEHQAALDKAKEAKQEVSKEDEEAYLKEQQAIADAPVTTKFRLIRESDLKEAPLTIEQVLVLQECGVLIPNEVKQEDKS